MARSKKTKTAYVCGECGEDTPRWRGQCPRCGAWNTLEEKRLSTSRSGARRRSSDAGEHGRAGPVLIGDVRAEDAARRTTGMPELDRVLGGGAVPGSAVLLGGDPGIGKSTLLMQALSGLTDGDAKGLYVSGEESAAQVALRARRLGVGQHVLVHATTELEAVEEAWQRAAPRTVVIDSVQTLRASDQPSIAGSVGQIREVAVRSIELAKQQGVTLFLIGHVTKEGTLAGPKVLEHLVDTVLAFETDTSGAYRIVRAQKNRFGAAHEVGVFEMTQEGLREVSDPSALFLAERPERSAGSAVVPTAEGSRPLLVEVQALVAQAAYGSARRVVSGVDGRRLAILLAVLDRKAGVHILDQDVFASVAGGARADERAVDLPLALAIVSSFRDRPLPPRMLSFGEVGLAGEVRAVPRAAARIQEAAKLGFERVILPRGNLERLDDPPRGVTMVGVSSLDEAIAETLR